MTDEIRVLQEQLDAPFPPQAIRKKQNRYDYLEHQTITRRLNSLGVPWSFVIRETWFRDDLQLRNKDGVPVITMVGLGELTIEGMGTRSGIGVANLQIGGGEDQYKGMESDALKKAAARFGVGLDLYGPDYEAGEIGPAAVRSPAPARDGGRRESAKGRAWEAAQKRNMTVKDFEVFLFGKFGKSPQAVTAEEFNSAAQWIEAQPQEVIIDFMNDAWAKVRAAG